MQNAVKSIDLFVRSMRETDIPNIKEFTDKMIGLNYYSLTELHDIFSRSQSHGTTFTLVLTNNENKIWGVRLTYPPGQWKKGKGSGLTPEKWETPFENVAYFQSLFIAPELTGQGWGTRISKNAIEMLRKIGTDAIVTHSWKESPGNSSNRYLRGLGFRHVAYHPFYWKHIDYLCSGCNVKPCVCTAEEMILKI